MNFTFRSERSFRGFASWRMGSMVRRTPVSVSVTRKWSPHPVPGIASKGALWEAPGGAQGEQDRPDRDRGAPRVLTGDPAGPAVGEKAGALGRLPRSGDVPDVRPSGDGRTLLTRILGPVARVATWVQGDTLNSTRSRQISIRSLCGLWARTMPRPWATAADAGRAGSAVGGTAGVPAETRSVFVGWLGGSPPRDRAGRPLLSASFCCQPFVVGFLGLSARHGSSRHGDPCHACFVSCVGFARSGRLARSVTIVSATSRSRRLVRLA